MSLASQLIEEFAALMCQQALSEQRRLLQARQGIAATVL